MSNLFQSLAKSSLIAVLALAPLFAHAENINWRGQWITVGGAEVKHIPYAGAACGIIHVKGSN